MSRKRKADDDANALARLNAIEEEKKNKAEGDANRRENTSHCPESVAQTGLPTLVNPPGSHAPIGEVSGQNIDTSASEESNEVELRIERLEAENVRLRANMSEHTESSKLQVLEEENCRLKRQLELLESRAVPRQR